MEGSVIVERQDANALAYQSNVTVKQLLSGSIEPPSWAHPLTKTLEACVGMPGGQKWVDDSADADFLPGSPDGNRNSYAFGSGSGVASPGSEIPPMNKKKSVNSPFPPPSWGRRKSGGSYFNSEFDNVDETPNNAAPRNRTPESSAKSQQAHGADDLIDGGSIANSFPTQFKSDYSYSGPDTTSSQRFNNTHRPTLSLNSDRPRNSSYRAGSPFNDLPPFPRVPSGSTSSHVRSASSTPFFGAKQSSGSVINGFSKSNANPFSARASDPFDYDTPGETIDDLPDAMGALKLGGKPYITPKAGLNEPLSPLEGVARAIALYDFKAVEVSLPFPACSTSF